MIEVQKTDTFANWIDSLRDQRAVAAILRRIARMERGLFGDVEPVGEGVSELRIDQGPGYRVYFIKTGKTVVVLLCGGDKSTQKKDIKAAKALAKNL